MFGAKGDGVDDDSEYINNALSSGHKKIYIPHGEYIINQTLNISSNDIVLYGEGVIISNTDVALDLSGNNCNIQINIDGVNNTRVGIYNRGRDNTIHGCSVKNIYSSGDSALAINTANNGFTHLYNNYVENVYSEENDVMGDTPGASRGIRVVGLSINDGNVLIENNRIVNIGGEEGDAIHLISSGKDSMPVTLKNNRIDTFSRRAIKIQCSNVDIFNNVIVNKTDHTSLTRVIDIQSVDNVFIDGNIIDVEFIPVFGLAGTPDKIVENVTITNNVVRMSSPLSLFYNTESNNVVIKNNEFIGGSVFTLSDTDNLEFSYNTIRDSLLTDQQYVLTLYNNENVNVIGNKIINTVYKRPLRTNAVNINIIENIFTSSIGAFEVSETNGNGVIARNILKNSKVTTNTLENHTVIDNTLIN